MRSLVYRMLLLPLLCQPLLFAGHAQAQAAVRMEVVDLGELSTGRPSKINLWFPRGTCEGASEKQFCLADNAITDKAIVFSHGAMGSAIEYSWIAEGLAAAGYVVVGINHFGESRIYGEQAINPRSTALIWQRPQDISAALDWLATQPLFQKPIDWSRIVAIGHSSGGQTAAMLAGAIFDLKLLTAYCASNQSQGDLSCNYGSKSASAPEAFQKQFSEQQKNARIRLAVMLDPALGSAVEIDSLHDVKVPSLVVGAQNNDFLPWSYHGLRYASEIPNASVRLLTGQEGHFVFLTPCHHPVKVMGVSLCEDRDGVDRVGVQRDLLQTTVEFIQSRSDAFAKPVSVDAPHKQYSNSMILPEIILYTPRWVFGLLAALLVFGLMQTRTRQVRFAVALILPVAMLLLSLTGVLRYVGWDIVALLCWLLGISLVAAISIKLSRATASYAASADRVTIQGSWVPLLIILGIFFTRYALGVVLAMDLPLVHEAYFLPLMSLLLGGWSGYFVARGYSVLQAKRGP